jgi:hypothetical protein
VPATVVRGRTTLVAFFILLLEWEQVEEHDVTRAEETSEAPTGEARED